MKIIIKLVLVLCLLFQNVNATGSTEGCPSNWNPSGPAELQSAKNQLGFNMVLQQGQISYSNFAGRLGALPQLIGGGQLNESDLFIYGDTTLQQKFTVQVKNCDLPADFTFNLGMYKNQFAQWKFVEDFNANNWSQTNENRFIDFVQARKFSECLDSATRLVKEGFSFTGNKLYFIDLGLKLRNFARSSGINTCGVKKGITLNSWGYLLLTPECRSNNEENGGKIALTPGKTCDFSITLKDFETKDIYVLPKSTLNSEDYISIVTCSKGKLRKKVTTYQGYEFQVKCPSGYKKI